MPFMHNSNLRNVLATRLRALMANSVDLQTQEALAKRSGVAQTTIGRILKQQVSPSVDIVESLALAFRVDISELVGEKKNSNELEYWSRDFEALPPNERDRIMQFIRFTIDQFKASSKTQGA